MRDTSDTANVSEWSPPALLRCWLPPSSRRLTRASVQRLLSPEASVRGDPPLRLEQCSSHMHYTPHIPHVSTPCRIDAITLAVAGSQSIVGCTESVARRDGLNADGCSVGRRNGWNAVRVHRIGAMEAALSVACDESSLSRNPPSARNCTEPLSLSDTGSRPRGAFDPACTRRPHALPSAVAGSSPRSTSLGTTHRTASRSAR